ncbi:conserved hypothetical protein [Mycobacterium tuberculosis CPHL_A]|uniref:Uncharacterized protein n=2 Tax=Mycobacterium tuberculosis TaxID=1773 RepID=A5TZC3_MYCTA|nr:hypothetical protein MT0407 [Mycobacterium tuberculosis CDC1551]ABQ72123.1 hypothetical protein MRA_0403 [Mycobacterium tuberculosis H37Ra]EAY58819.1 conserved 13E12 repeat family protein [Mycobacterium tuberculosis C]EFD16093.1 conserved hypothetical protein [Mycobacterium tuberculosis CPHL_A]
MKYNNIRTPCLYPIPVFWAGAYRLEGRRVVVGIGWWAVSLGGGCGGLGDHVGNPAGLVVAVAFGGDVVGAVLRSGAGPARHHRGALPAAVGAGRVGSRWVTGGGAQRREQQRAARGGDIGLVTRQRPNHGAVGQLLGAPAPEGGQQMMAPITRRTF